MPIAILISAMFCVLFVLGPFYPPFSIRFPVCVCQYDGTFFERVLTHFSTSFTIMNKCSIKWESHMFLHSMTFDLGEDVHALQETVHRWAQERVKPMAAEIDRTNEFPNELWREMGDLGLLGVTVDEAYGGANMSYLAHTIVVENCPRQCICQPVLWRAFKPMCEPDQIERNRRPKTTLPAQVDFGRTCWRIGDVRTLCWIRCRVDEAACGKTQRILGFERNKYWITNGPDADTLVVYAKTDPDAGSKGITAFIVQKEMTGFSTSPF